MLAVLTQVDIGCVFVVKWANQVSSLLSTEDASQCGAVVEGR